MVYCPPGCVKIYDCCFCNVTDALIYLQKVYQYVKDPNQIEKTSYEVNPLFYECLITCQEDAQYDDDECFESCLHGYGFYRPVKRSNLPPCH